MYLTEKGNSISLTPRLIMIYEVLYVLIDPKGFCAMAHDSWYVFSCIIVTYTIVFWFVRKCFFISLYI